MFIGTRLFPPILRRQSQAGWLNERDFSIREKTSVEFNVEALRVWRTWGFRFLSINAALR